ncbi:caspase-1-like protein, partial [Leptotrombidium deliense]
HGSEDILYAQDESYNYNTLFAPFASAKCNGKAKLFFINASQGNQWDVGNEICTDACDIPLYVPKGDDFLVALSSVPEFTTMSHQERGSFFMQALIESLRNNESNDDILTVLTNVKKRIAAELSANYGNVLEYKGECVLRETRKQMPIFFSTLRQQVYV